jgi:hypothetical protein
MPMEKRAVIAEKSLFECASAPSPHLALGETTDPPGGAG